MNDESIFTDALQKSDPAERAAFLNQACDGNAEQRARVEALLAAHNAAGSFLGPRLAANVQTVTLAPRTAATEPPPFVECPGTRIGPYKLLQQIGEGGMGTVWMAEQMEPVRRNVALKIVKAGLDSSQVIARFEAERQALALMDHPNIARVLDAGSTASGRPFFVMELVKGLPITKYCDDHKLSVRQRLEIFIPVCLALQHAHQKGIIHRDVKPSNVLVAPYDGKPVVKVIDFGVAKATGQRLTEKTMFTQFGAVVGTLEYMSPEQAELNNQDIDTRSDIYALGVLLYELLTGTTPLNMERLRGAAFAAILMEIQEQEPPRPSARLTESRETLTTVSAQRQTDPIGLSRLVRGELDWIVMKALAKERGRRYDTAGNFARDIEHHLHEELVEASPPSPTYRLRKLIRRNRGAVAATAVILLALVSGIVGTTWGLVRANHALGAEAKQRKQAEIARAEEAQARIVAETERTSATRARDEAERSLYFNRINLAYQYWLSGRLDQSGRILELCPPAARGWEWSYLYKLHHVDLLTLPGNTPYTTGLYFSKDGKRLAAFAQSSDAGVRIWELNANKPLAVFPFSKDQRPLSCVALSPDGNILAIADDVGAVTFWQADSGKFIRDFAKLQKMVTSLSFSPDGRWLAAGRSNHPDRGMSAPLGEPNSEDLVVWDVTNNHEVFHPKGFGLIAKFSPDGSRLLTTRKNTVARPDLATPDSFFVLFDTTNWTEVTHSQFDDESYCFSGDGKRLALGGFDRQKDQSYIHILDTATGKQLFSVTPKTVGDIALNYNGTIACICTTSEFASQQIEVWDIKNGHQIRSIRGHTGFASTVAFAPDGRLASCSWDDTIKFWDPNLAQDVRQLTSGGRGARPALFSPDGALLAYGQYTADVVNRAIRTVTLVDAQTGRVMQALGGHDGGAQTLAFNKDGSRLVSGGLMGDVKVWDVSNGALVRTIPGNGHRFLHVALSPDGRWVAVTHEAEATTAGGRQETNTVSAPVSIFSTETGHLRSTLTGSPSRANQLTFSPDGKLLASAGYSLVKIWDSSTGILLHELNQTGNRYRRSNAIAFSKSGKLLATENDEIIHLWDTITGRSVAVFQGHALAELCVAISPDESRLASAGQREVKLWDIHSGQETLNLPLPRSEAAVVSLAWSADGQHLRAALNDCSIVEWSASRP